MALTDLPSAARVNSFLALERQVSSLSRSVDFYVRGLGFVLEPETDVQGPAKKSGACAVLRLGDERIVLRQVWNPGAQTAPRVGGFDVRFQHVAIVASDMEAAYERLQACAPEAISLSGPQQLPPASGGVTAFKFRDPDGHALELIAFPELPERWRDRAGTGLTLGIDHAAISVLNAERSIAFYEGLGLQVGARQTNRGWEQAQLDGLRDGDVHQEGREALAQTAVEVEVVALMPEVSGGVHLELLAYRMPCAVRPPLEQHRLAPSFEDCLVWQGSDGSGRFTDPDGHLFKTERG